MSHLINLEGMKYLNLLKINIHHSLIYLKKRLKKIKGDRKKASIILDF